MRHPAPLPAGSALPLRSVPPVSGRPPLALAPAAIAGFNDLLHGLHPDAPHVDADALSSISPCDMETSRSRAMSSRVSTPGLTCGKSPVSSNTSRTAASSGSSFGSM